MDINTAKQIQQLKANPAAIRQLMDSPDGQALLQALTGGDNGAALQKAMQSAVKGDTGALSQMVNQVAQSPQGSALMERITGKLQK